MTEVLTSAQMRAVEAAAIASGTVTGLELMERAGRGVVEAVFDEWPELRGGAGTDEYWGQDENHGPRRAVVLCGPGNNGGDGFVVARLLHGLGWEVEVYLYGDPAKLPPDARVNYVRWCGIGEVRALELDAVSAGRPVALCVDALFGTGLARAVATSVVAAVKALFNAFLGDSKVVSVDLPSGLCADSGRVLAGETAGPGLGEVLRPDLTVSFHRAKVGHCLSEGLRQRGRLRVVDIGLDALPSTTETATVPTPTNAVGKATDAHKYSHGHALILSGPAGRGGAARLAARGALRIGAGVVTVGCAADALAEHASRLDAVMLREVVDARALAAVLEDGRINALCLGPGMGAGAREAALVGVALRAGVARRGEPRRALVLDADALTLIARDAALFGALHDRCVLTPHAGEFARLFPDIAARLAAPATTGPAYSKVDATRDAAARAGCTVLFKGPDTVIAGPDGRCAVNSAPYDRTAPWLATAGSGDVLAGFISGLLARGFAPFDAACTGAWLHVECARSFGPGLIAEDLPEALPKVFRALGV
ncbi:MAG: NAD(P)H-hydrate dehydratase [Pseudotabrizicola sp.]|uniref:NAD(P)H-hydrate dehydratase n=2 Tax=Pseudotabrizicola sp. TaxID=2939647 RepID=UPI00272F8D61|nr:NAD(P)H-hydrate dehydratase [Pseudotabrizicola sp.]MDP2083114.1 NAD(P)H-hydrate dehydratase [Pseudotabrizicola sp.]MDZ7572532.1 NAD(P)H-hydrate dehydratase [Pseudotabrizicola sp.]